MFSWALFIHSKQLKCIVCDADADVGIIKCNCHVEIIKNS